MRLHKRVHQAPYFLNESCSGTPRIHFPPAVSSINSFYLNLAKIPPNQVIADFGRGSSVESESAWCPAGIIERFELFKMASKMATLY